MKTYKLIVEPKSPFVTPLQSDTVFGHLAWALAYLEGPSRLSQMLNEFVAGKPPFLLSEAFPENTLPVPILPPPSAPEVNRLVNWVLDSKEKILQKLERSASPQKKKLKDEFERALAACGSDKLSMKHWVTEQVKRTKGIRYIPFDLFKQIQGSASPVELAKLLLNFSLDGPGLSYTRAEVVMRTAVDRVTSAAREGMLFELEETFYGRKDENESYSPTRLCIWLKLQDNSLKLEVAKWFKVIEGSGFGKWKSTGLGQFTCIGDIEETELPSPPQANAFLTLSSYVPCSNDPPRGYYRCVVKRGKLGGPWALSGNVWKTPLLMFSPGSVFYTTGEIKEHYGRIVPVHQRDGTTVYQYGYAFPLGIKLRETREQL